MVSILSTFNVGKAKGPDGVEVEIDPDTLTGSVIRQAQDLLYRYICFDVYLYSAPEPFVCSLFLDLLELKVSFAMRSILYIQILDFDHSSRCIFFRYSLGLNIIEIDIHLLNA
jgi:hypothetical protein